MMSTKQSIVTLSTVAIAAVIVLSASGPIVAIHPAQAQSCFGGHGGHQDCDVNPPTGNPHPPSGSGDPTTQTGTETGNPHNSAGCTGDPHDEVGTDGTCHGSQ